MKQIQEINSRLRYPIVSVMGHVDHGKTSLLDYIRKTKVASGEAGGITQHIGAYQIDFQGKNKSPYNKITFIDTPGHEAFSKMRGRGANVSDIAILVVAANDGVMPQTIESIEHIKASGIHSIVALNKVDMPGINTEKIKKQLTTAGLKLEEYGGDIPLIPVSAKNGQGIEKLLESVILLAELYQIKEDFPGKTSGTVIESVISKNRGILGTVILRSGRLKTGDELSTDEQSFKIRALLDHNGNQLQEVSAGSPIQILGWNKIPPVGSKIYSRGEIQLTDANPKELSARENKLPSVYQPQELTEEKINIILRSDTAGTLEAITANLKDTTNVLSATVGNINESDVLLAKTTKAVVVGFHQKVPEQVKKLAQSEKVILKTYDIIYELFEEIGEVAEALKKGDLVEVLGQAKVMALFPFNNETVAGVKVISGRIARGDQVKIMRNNEEIARAKIKSLRHFKEEINKVEEGKEAGILFNKSLEVLTGDSIISIG